MARICNPCKTISKLYRLNYKPQAVICLWFFNKENYIPQNLVEEVLVSKTEDYIYSSIIDYAEKKGLLKDTIVVRELIKVFPHDAIVR